MFDYLEGFEERMKFVAIVEAITNRKGTNSEIENWFEKNELDNLFFTLLLYIMEQTLNENDECTIENMVSFMDKVLPLYNKNFSHEKVKTLTEYMVKDILQNKGEVKSYQIMNYSGGMRPLNIKVIKDKLLDDGTIVYELADPGYDFLFRTREIDKELDFKLGQLKLKELLKRKNYQRAVVQSKNLVSMLRQKQKELENFIYKIRQDIREVDKAEYERLLKETYSLIDEDYQEMTTIKNSIEQDENRIKQVLDETGYIDDTMSAAMENLFKIRQNILQIMSEQKNLIMKRFSLNSMYEEIIESSFYTSIVKRYDFEKEVLEPLTRITETGIPQLINLLAPLYRPNLNKILNISTLYQRQSKLKEIGEESLTLKDEEIIENELINRVHKKNELNLNIIVNFFRYAADKHESFTFSEFYEFMKSKTVDMRQYTEGKLIFLIMFKLYDIRVIDINKWEARTDKNIVLDANGEFDLEWSLNQIEHLKNDFYGISKLEFEKLNGQISIETMEQVEPLPVKNIIELNDFIIIPYFKEKREDE